MKDMKSNVNLRLSKITTEDILAVPEKAPNPEIWEEAVRGLALKDSVQFYVAIQNTDYSYTRYFVSYTNDGIIFFESFNPFLQKISNRGYCMIIIDPEGLVNKIPFTAICEKDEYLDATEENKAIFRGSNVAKCGIMISNIIWPRS